ncbi:MAG TPA: sensor histidine kinase [Rhodocyclaceae bacterium]|nr:histidine kinase [Rhodocyclaceae bacterium]HNA03031.1 sensor histidine kinase [Rhodocyclaceae bacterium]HNB77835.1 sensor histidine kinase [Rhodocyclaceae bacterium]HNC61513.1 sensor histidine kinase [Rhodocyclaceae bacterium]HNH14588.1 sensor histidine kinase [Rhodocyclaceae bacterium]
MLQGSTIIAISLAYLGVLFAVAYYGDKRSDHGRSLIANPTIYALSLAVYCTTWTFYGSVGRAASTGIGFLPIYLGPTMIAALWWWVLVKMVRIAKANRITSIADFVASRYGKSQLIGGLVTVIAVIGIVPYISLQLKAVSNSFSILLGYPEIVMPSHAGELPVWRDTSLLIALAMAAFTIVFGTRHLDATERHEGMVAAIAFESIIKLVAFTAVGLWVTFGLFDGFGDIFARAAEQPQLAKLMQVSNTASSYGSWASLTLLSMLSVMFLPRQFQIAVVENVNEDHVRRAIWQFPLYLLLINIFVLPIALGGMLHFSAGGVDADTFVLTLPMSQRQEVLALLVFIGGLSAATGMVIVETIALSTMVCNDLVMPLLLRSRWFRVHQRADMSGLLLTIRRGAILVILLLGYIYFRAAGEAYALVGIGLISFAAVAQFAPVIFGGMYWKGGTRNGALAGLFAGFAVWAYTLLLPSFAKSGWLPVGFLQEGLFGIALLRPTQLFGLTGMDEITHCLFWSLLANTAAYAGVSLSGRPSATETSQATLFVDAMKQGAQGAGSRFWRGSAQVDELLPLIGRFLGPQRAQLAFENYARQRGRSGVADLQADAGTVHYAESLLAGAIGSASARVMVASVVKEEPLGLDEVMNILDEASQVRAYSRQLEQKSRELERATAELRAANERLQELDRLKDDFMSSVTHELRTPLTSIRAFSEILFDNPEMDAEERQNFLSIITRETERLTRLVNQVLDMAKIESGRTEWQTEALDLREVIDSSIASVSQVYREKDVALVSEMPDKVPTLMADRDRLIQVMLNLLSNAVKFVSPGSGRVAVRLTHSDAGLRVDVEDNGPGIRPEDQQVIFEKFRQGGDTMTDKPQGTGLGLPISKQIVEHFGGHLWVESEPGKGAVFSFTLPLQAEAADDAAGAALAA